MRFVIFFYFYFSMSTCAHISFVAWKVFIVLFDLMLSSNAVCNGIFAALIYLITFIYWGGDEAIYDFFFLISIWSWDAMRCDAMRWWRTKTHSFHCKFSRKKKSVREHFLLTLSKMKMNDRNNWRWSNDIHYYYRVQRVIYSHSKYLHSHMSDRSVVMWVMCISYCLLPLCKLYMVLST